MIMIHKLFTSEASTHGLKQKKDHKVIKVNQSLWLKLHIDLNTKIRKTSIQAFPF